MEEGYLLIYSEQDEVHTDLIPKEFYDIITKAIEAEDGTVEDIAFDEASYKARIHCWKIQTFCTDSWPYNDTKILGTISIPRT